MSISETALLKELTALRTTHQRHAEELHDPALALYHERNGGFEETTAPFLALAQSTVLQLDAIIAAIGGQAASDAARSDTGC